MSYQINLPINQVKLTNVAVVRLKKSSKQFEIACYRNKVNDYRNGIEKDLSEVLQTDRIFTNVSKGQFANSKDLMKAFNSKDQEKIAMYILENGQSEMNDLERKAKIDNTLIQIATLIANNCLHPISQRPYTVNQIKDWLVSNSFNFQIHKPIKKQYLDGVKFLKDSCNIPIERAKMELKFYFSYNRKSNRYVHDCFQKNNIYQFLITLQEANNKNENSHANMKEQLKEEGKDEKDFLDDQYYNIQLDGQEYVITIQVDPSLYRILNDLCKQAKNSRLEISEQVVTHHQGEVHLEEDIKRKRQLQAQRNKEKQMEENRLPNNDIGEPGEDHQVLDHLKNVNLQDENNNRDNFKNSHIDDINDKEDLLEPSSRKNQQKAAGKKGKKEKRRLAKLKQQQQTISQRTEVEIISSEAAKNDNPTSAFEITHKNINDNPNARSCNTCGGCFLTDSFYRQHFRSDWHRYNLKLKLKGVNAISEEEFTLCDASLF